MNDTFVMLLPIIVGATIGYLTNWVAIKLLFWPKKAIGPIHGAIPKNKERIAGDIAKVAVNNLFTTEQLIELVGENFSEDRLKEMISESSTELISYANLPENKEKLVGFITNLLSKDGQPNPLVTMFLQGAVSSINLEEATKPYHDNMTNTISDKLYPIMLKRLPGMVEKAIPADILENKIRETVKEMDEDEVEKLINDITARELHLIKWSGAVLGALIGIAQILIFMIK